MEPTTASATELRESIMALTRQLRRHRSDNGLTLSQQQVLGEVIRAGVTTPAELAMRIHVRVQSLTDGINHLESSGLVARRTDADDRRRQLIEATADGVALLEADRAERDEWLNTAMRETLTELEFNLLMLVAPVLRKLADGDERPREEQTKRDERPREEQTKRDERPREEQTKRDERQSAP